MQYFLLLTCVPTCSGGVVTYTIKNKIKQNSNVFVKKLLGKVLNGNGKKENLFSLHFVHFKVFFLIFLGKSYVP